LGRIRRGRDLQKITATNSNIEQILEQVHNDEKRAHHHAQAIDTDNHIITGRCFILHQNPRQIHSSKIYPSISRIPPYSNPRISAGLVAQLG